MKGWGSKVEERVLLFTTRFRLRTVLAFALILGSLVAPSAFGLQIVRLCNQGSVHIAVTWAQETRAGLGMGQLWESEGWDWISPNDCSNVWVSSADNDTVLNMVFAVRTPQGTFGVIDLPLKVRDIPNRQKSICVHGDPDHRGSMGSSPVPPCRSPYREAPTSSALWIPSNFDWKLFVKPSATDFERMAVVLSGDASQVHRTPPSSVQQSTVEPPQPSFLERVAGAYNESVRKRENLIQSCKRALPGATASGREKYCNCMSDAVRNTLDSKGEAALAQSWTQSNLDSLRPSFPFDTSRCPTIDLNHTSYPITVKTKHDDLVMGIWILVGQYLDERTAMNIGMQLKERGFFTYVVRNEAESSMVRFDTVIALPLENFGEDRSKRHAETLDKLSRYGFTATTTFEVPIQSSKPQPTTSREVDLPPLMPSKPQPRPRGCDDDNIFC